MRIRGPWDEAETSAYLESARFPVRVACNRRDGFPLIVSLWYLWEGGALWCAVHRGAVLSDLLAADGRCGFEVAPNDPPYLGVRGRAVAETVPGEGERLLGRLLDRYLGSRESRLARWLLSRAEDELAWRLVPSEVFSWDYRERM